MRMRWRGLGAAPRAFVPWLRRSLMARAAAVSLVLSLITSAAVFGFLTLRISKQLYESRRDVIVSASSTAVNEVQSLALASTAQDDQSLQSLKASMVRTAESTAGTQEVALLHDDDGDASVFTSPDLISATFDPSEIPQELRDRVRDSPDAIFWQPVRIGTDTPGIIVGSMLTLPLAGQHEIFLRHSLAPEAATLSFVQWTLLGGGALLTIISVGITAVSAVAILRPIRRTAQVSRRLAAGDLGQRLPQSGADEAVDLGRSFNSMADALESRITELANLSRLQRRFVSDVSHELRTPATTIRLASDVVYRQREGFDTRTRRSAEILHDQVARFEGLLADLLEMSRFDAGVAALRTARVDLSALVDGVVDELGGVAGERGSAIVVQHPADAMVADVDASRISRAVRNLLANAIEHGQGHPIEVRLAATERARPEPQGPVPAVAISVTDHGVGIDGDDLPRVFDRFWRADSARKRTIGGTGLGLAITKEDVELHGGTVTVQSDLGDGSTFTITVPVRRA